MIRVMVIYVRATYVTKVIRGCTLIIDLSQGYQYEVLEVS